MRVVIAEDLALLREGMASLLTAMGHEVLGQADDADALMRLVRAHRPDVAIVDIRMPPTHTDEGISATHRIRREHPEVAVLVVSQYVDTEFALELISEGGGSVGYLLKDRIANRAELADAVGRVAAGGAVIDPEVVARLVGRPRVANPLDDLTPREREVLAMIAEGRSNTAVGQRLYLSPKTVEAHVRSIFLKLGLDDKPDDHRRVLAVLAYLRG